MKTYILSALTVVMAATVIAPAAQADGHTVRRQVSSPTELSEDATFHDLVLHNRRVRNKG